MAKRSGLIGGFLRRRLTALYHGGPGRIKPGRSGPRPDAEAGAGADMAGPGRPLRLINRLARIAGGYYSARLPHPAGPDESHAALARRTPEAPYSFSDRMASDRETGVARLASRLSQDHEIGRALRNWPDLERTTREKICRRIHRHQARAFGFRPVPVFFRDLDRLKLGSMALPAMLPGRRKLGPTLVLLTGLGQAPVERVFELLVHEGRHAQQYQMISDLRRGRISARDPRYADILAMSRNMQGYVMPSARNPAEQRRYKSQPVETDACSTGRLARWVVLGPHERRPAAPASRPSPPRPRNTEPGRATPGPAPKSPHP